VATEPVERADAEPDYVPLSVDSLLGEEPDYVRADERAGEPGTGAALHEGYPDDEGYADDEEEDEPLPLLEADDGPMPMPEWTDVASSETVPEAHEGVAEPGEFALPIVAGADPDEADIRLEDGFDALARADADVDERQEPAVADVAPAFGNAGGVVPGAAPVADAEPDVDVPDDIPVEFVAPRTPEDRARALIAEGREDDALDILEHAAGAAEEREATHEALRLADVMVELAPRSVRALRLRADSARRADDRDRLVPAYAALAERLRESGDAEAARKAYERVLAADPSHEGARTALAPATPPPAGAPSAGGAGRAASPGDYVDLAALVGEETLETTRFVVEEEVPTGDEDQDFHEMLSQFRSKVSEHVSVEDTASHYDLGIAFKEMGLIDEAIAEFQTALRFGAQRLKVYEELGQCFMEKGDYAIAEKLLRQGSNEMATDPSELLGVNYHLGRCYEQLDRPEDAREAYERVLSLDIDFRDVSERLKRL
jgi:tetratricopeptide (TPR) repeat protein